MSRRISSILFAFIAVLTVGVVFAWVHFQGRQPVISITPEPAVTTDTSPVPAVRDTATEAPRAPAAKKPEPEPGFLPRAGEVLEFSADVAKVNNVANLRLQVGQKTELDGQEVWHLQAVAHTQNPLRMIFPLDDQFDSYCHVASFASLQYEMRLNERGQKEDSVQRMSTTAKEPAPPGISIARVLPGTRDPLGFMQYLRSVDWIKTPQVRSPVYDGRKLYEVIAARKGTAQVQVAAGDFSTNAIEIRVFENGAEMKDAHFTLYLAKDAQRLPVLLEAVMPFASARVELMKRTD